MTLQAARPHVSQKNRLVKWGGGILSFVLPLQRETLLRQLETNQLDIDATLEELSVQQETEDQNYSMYVSQHLQLSGEGGSYTLCQWALVSTFGLCL